jgi:hypothetical protein
MGMLPVTPGLLPFVTLILMESHTFPQIASFVIRFVMDTIPTNDEAKPNYRGVIRHIQSEEELSFTSWEDADIFIRHYVPLETEAGQIDT